MTRDRSAAERQVVRGEEARDNNHIELELIRRLEGRDVTHVRYRVGTSRNR